MTSGTKLRPEEDPGALAAAARAFLAAGEDIKPTPLEGEIRRAFKLLKDDLAKIEALRLSKKDVPYAEIFSAQPHEKVAALVFLIEHLLNDVAHGPTDCLEITDAKTDLTGHHETLLRLNALDAFAILYDFAWAQSQAEELPLWQKSCTYYLHTLARMTDARPRAYFFLKERPHARRQVEQLIASTDQNVAGLFRTLGEDYVRLRQEIDPAAAPSPPAYARLLLEYTTELPSPEQVGLAARIVAEERIRAVMAAGNLAVLARWVMHGSRRAARAALDAARGALPTSGYITLLEQALSLPDAPPERLAAAVVELGEVSRTLRQEGGESEINRLLVEFAVRAHAGQVGVAQLAVRELRAVNAFNDVLSVMERTSIVEVAEEGMRMMCEMRRLVMVESLVQRRPVLNLSYQAAHKHLMTIQELMNAAWGCTSDATAHVYLERLKELRAYPELEQLGLRHKHISTLANKSLAELRMQEMDARRR